MIVSKILKVLSVVALFALVTEDVKGQILINELCPANADIKYDPQFFNFSPWIELYNSGNSSVNVGGYFLSDDPAEKTKWAIPPGTTIPPKGFLLIWCDNMNTGLHTNFSLNSEGEEIILSSAGGISVDQRSYPLQFTNISYGRVANGEINWGFLLAPTPGASNNPLTASQTLVTPNFSIEAGRYTSAKRLILSHPSSGVKIYYTEDGSEPTAASKQYTDAVAVNRTSSIKAKAFKEGFLPSPTETRTYFIGEHVFTLPSISISTNPDYLWNNTIGIYTNGTNGISGNCQQNPMNWNQDWDRHAVFEYFDNTGSLLVNREVDIRIGGACSRNQPQKSFVIKAREQFGGNTIRHRFFTSKKVNEFGGFILRNSGNDFNVTMFRDALMQSLVVGQMDIDYMAYQPTIFYLNGQYWGIQNLREKIDADFIESNYGYKKDEIDLLETWDDALEGTSDAWLSYKNTLQSMDRSTPEAFSFIDQHIDVEEYISYLVSEIYYANTDWPGNNIKFWRPRASGGKFRWILWDTDFGFGLYDGLSYPTHPTLSFATDPDNVGWPNPAASTLHIRMVLENPEFRSRFIKKLSASMNTTFSPTRVNRFIDNFRDGIATEMVYHKQRWGGEVENWNFEVQRLRDFAAARNQYMRGHMAEFFGLGESIRMSVTVFPEGSGTFKLNGITADQDIVESEYFKGLEYTLEPGAKPGYKFKQWNVRKRESDFVPLIATGDDWKYFDKGSLPAANWTSSLYNDAAWAEGPAQLGYGESDEQTVVSFGPNAGNKYITTYFRKTFTVADTTRLEQLKVSALFDDGIVVYLNGVEVYRNNMPNGTITNTTPALTAIQTENNYALFTVNRGLLKPGDNVVAVEIHQSGASSSDISFDFGATTFRIGNETEEVIQQSTIEETAQTDLVFEAVFEPDDRFVSGLVINEINARPSGVVDNMGDAEDWIELYNAGTQPVNLAGLYISDNPGQMLKHKILAGTSGEMLLAPDEYKILWADEEINEGPDHLSFKLSNEGEAVGLYQVVDNTAYVVDELFFGGQTMEGSFSRIPNGDGPLEFTVTSTPGGPNMFVLSIEKELPFAIYPNPVSSDFIIQSQSPVYNVEVLDPYGRRVSYSANIIFGEPISIRHLSAGLYLLRFQIAGRWYNVKLIKE